MGRARTPAPNPRARDQFASVLGAHRGLSSAQSAERKQQERERADAQREVAWQRQREHNLRTWFTGISQLSGSRTAFTKLVDGYNAGAHVADADGSDELVENLLDQPTIDAPTLVLGCMADHGDPVGWPGLTDPAVRALSRYLRTPRERPDDNQIQVEAGHLLAGCFESTALNEALSTAEKDAYYLRLQPLADAIAQVMPGSGRMSVPATVVLAGASVSSLAGPLRSWVLVCAQRFDDGDLSEREQESLKQTIAVRARTEGPAFEAAFAPLIMRLS
jgi:hypothetical protein